MALPDIPPTFKPITPPDLAWWWRLRDASGAEVEAAGEHAGQRFPNRGDAESWLGEVWRELAAGGASAAQLVENDREVGGVVELAT